MTVTSSKCGGDTPCRTLAAAASASAAASSSPMPRWGYRYTPEERARIKQFAAEGKSPREVAALTGRPLGGVEKMMRQVVRKRAPQHRVPGRWNRFARERLAELLNAGRRPSELGPEFGTTGMAVEIAVTRYGLRHLVRRGACSRRVSGDVLAENGAHADA